MSRGAPKLIFLALFILNCLLWSHSRYAQIPRYASSGSLTKRSLLESSLLDVAFTNGAEYIDTKEQVSRFKVCI